MCDALCVLCAVYRVLYCAPYAALLYLDRTTLHHQTPLKPVLLQPTNSATFLTRTQYEMQNVMSGVIRSKKVLCEIAYCWMVVNALDECPVLWSNYFTLHLHVFSLHAHELRAGHGTVRPNTGVRRVFRVWGLGVGDEGEVIV